VTEISAIPAAGGEAIQLGPVQLRILEDGRTTGHRLGVGEITIAAHARRPAAAPARPARRRVLHRVRHRPVHRGGHELRRAGRDVRHDPARRPAHLRQPGRRTGGPAEHVPPPDLYVQYFRDLRDMIAAGQPLTPDNADAVMSRHATVPAADFAEETP
jgi:hypothetical protein